MPLVLTTNEVVLNPDHAWNDVEGVQYHYPNGYKNRGQVGEPFVYYRGVHRKSGKRGEAEYFGRGRIGAIRLDPESKNPRLPSRFCAIEDYVPFAPPVPAKLDGVFYETIAKQNGWRVAVREISQATFDAIVQATGGVQGRASLILPGPAEANDLIIPRSKVAGSTGGGSGYRKSKQAKTVGDWAEHQVVQFLEQLGGCAEIVHRAGQGETPGWDIDYRDPAGVLHRVEVKGTVGRAFTSIDLTANELRSAREHRDSYWIFLVAGCLNDRPRIQRICDPAGRLEAGEWSASPSLYSVRLG